jgi:hypothetical protein
MMTRIISPPRVALLPALLMLTSLAFVAGGCAHFEYDLVEPAEHAAHIGTKSPVEVRLEPIRYEAQTSSDHLVLVIHNETQDPLKLLGEDSFAVDPNGESHPLPTRTVAPGTSTKLILPPVKPTFRETGGPTIGVGVGVGVAHGYGRRGYYHGGFAGDPWYYDDYPRYYRLEDDGTVYWNWSGNGTDVRLRLVYRQGDRPPFHHDFTFRRVKM